MDPVVSGVSWYARDAEMKDGLVHIHAYIHTYVCTCMCPDVYINLDIRLLYVVTGMFSINNTMTIINNALAI